MRFEVSPAVFELLPDACFGVVAVKGADNSKPIPEVSALLHESIAACEKALEGIKVKESPEIVPYRDAFRALNINPNKFMCSIEALLTRIAKGKGFPEISPVVVYVSDGQVRTRRWTWRQSEIGKITPETTDLLFPIDGFTSLNLDRVLAARAELAEGLERLFGAKTAVGLVDKDHCVFEAEL